MTTKGISSQASSTRPTFEQFTRLRPIVINGQWRSGTTLLQRLFDGHPQLLVYPYEDCILRGYYPGPDYYLDSFLRTEIDVTLRNRQPDDLLQELCRISKLAKALEEHPRAKEWKSLFLSEMERLEDWTIENVFLVWMYSYFITEGVTSFDNCAGWVSKTPDNGYLTETILTAFPKAFIVQLIRDPRAVYASVCARHARDLPYHRGNGIRPRFLRFLDLLRTAKEWRTSFRTSEKSKSLYPNNYLLLRYEDLVLQSQGVMDHLAKLLNIQDHPTLYMPTMRGETWFRNTSFTPFPEENIVQPDSAKNRPRPLNPIQELILRHFTEKGCDELGYY